jgi:DNA modification methylase
MGSRAYDDQRLGPAKCVERADETPSYAGSFNDSEPPPCDQLARVLKPTGSFYYHCDWHASHHVRVMLNQIFGDNNFQAEIIWA